LGTAFAVCVQVDGEELILCQVSRKQELDITVWKA